jgi:hypothetical protein
LKSELGRNVATFPVGLLYFFPSVGTVVGNSIPNQLVVPRATRRNNAGYDEHVCVRTRAKARYFKGTCMNAVNNVGVTGRSTHKVKMWV